MTTVLKDIFKAADQREYLNMRLAHALTAARSIPNLTMTPGIGWAGGPIAFETASLHFKHEVPQIQPAARSNTSNASYYTVAMSDAHHHVREDGFVYLTYGAGVISGKPERIARGADLDAKMIEIASTLMGWLEQYREVEMDGPQLQQAASMPVVTRAPTMRYGR